MDDFVTVLLDEHVALTSEDSSGSELVVDLLDDGRRSNEERCSGVGNGFALVQGVRAKSDGVNVELPVSLRGKGNESEVSGVVSRVNTSENQLSTISGGGVDIAV